MIVPEKPLWGGNKKVCMYVITMYYHECRPQKLGFFPKKLTVALKDSCTRASSVWAKRLGRVDMTPLCQLA